MNFRTISITLIFLLLTLIPNTIKGDHHYTEEKVKSAFIYSICKFVSWPEIEEIDIDNSLILGIVGETSLINSLLSLNGKLINGRKFCVKKAGRKFLLKNFHVIFISQDSKSRIKSVLKKVYGLPILTISDSPGFCKMGGIINLLKINNKIRFEVNLKKAQGNNIRLSSKLLRLAAVIH